MKTIAHTLVRYLISSVIQDVMLYTAPALGSVLQKPKAKGSHSLHLGRMEISCSTAKQKSLHEKLDEYLKGSISVRIQHEFQQTFKA